MAMAPDSKSGEPQKGLAGSTPVPSAAWHEHGISIGATHIIIMYDGDEKDTYPVYVMPGDNLAYLCHRLKLSEGHQKLKEVISLSRT